MGLFDKLKEAADEGAEALKKAGTAAKEKVEDVQIRRRADELAKQLGYLVSKTGSVGEDGERLATQVRDLERTLAEGAPPPPEGAIPDAGKASEAQTPGE